MFLAPSYQVVCVVNLIKSNIAQKPNTVLSPGDVRFKQVSLYNTVKEDINRQKKTNITRANLAEVVDIVTFNNI